MKLSKLAELKRTVGEILNEAPDKDFPQQIMFSRGIEFPKYRITIDQIEEDYFIDSKGQKWEKVKEKHDIAYSTNHK